MGDALTWTPPDYSDAGNAVVLVNEYHGLLAFCDALGWLSWTGTHWEQNDHKAVGRAIELTEHMVIEAQVEMEAALREAAEAKAAQIEGLEGADGRLKKAIDRAERAKEYYRHATKSRNMPRITGMLEASKPQLWIAADRLDADPFILNTPGGIVDLWTGEIKPHNIESPMKWCTKITAVSPGLDGAEIWAEFLQTITCGDGALAGFLQQVAGMAAIGRAYHEGIIIANGSGRHGKSTFFNALAA